MKPILEVNHISKQYLIGTSIHTGLRHTLENALRFWVPKPPKHKPFWALKDVSFTLEPGQVLGICGRNGAGKSTLLKILSKITPPTTGDIYVRGRIASLLEVGTGFHPELTGRENIFLNGSLLGMKRQEIQKKLDAIIDFANIAEFIDTPVKRYSSGMYVRLAFAVAAHLEPEILILDEVLAVGDAAFQKKCIAKMESVARNEGRTVLFVSHQMSAVRRLCTHGLYLEQGTADGIISVDQAIQLYNAQPERVSYSVQFPLRNLPVEITAVQCVKPPVYGEELRVHVSISTVQPIANAIIGLGFDGQDGHRVLTLDTDNGGNTINIPAGKHVFEVCMPFNPLSPTTYACTVGLVQGLSVLDSHQSFAYWEVQTGDKDTNSERGAAGCRPQISTQLLS